MPDPTTIGAATLYCGDCLEVMAGEEIPCQILD